MAVLKRRADGGVACRVDYRPQKSCGRIKFRKPIIHAGRKGKGGAQRKPSERRLLSEKSAISARAVEHKIIGAKGEENNGMVKFTIGRSRHREERSAFELIDGLSLREPL
jgi:hypothetical protein